MHSRRTDILRELQAPDEATLVFNSFGLGGRLEPEHAAAFQAATIARAVLADNVPEDVRDNFERTRKLHLHGVLEYEFFTAAGDYALLVLEGALRVRFLALYSDGIPLMRGDAEELLHPETFEDVLAARGARLRGGDGSTHRLPLSADALLAWARREQLLAGTRVKIIEGILTEGRNHAAHPVGHAINTPVDSARTLGDVAETINKLWGHDTPGGRLFPGPVARQPKVAAVAPDGSGGCQMRLEQVHEADEGERVFNYAVFLAVEAERLIEPRRGSIGFASVPGFQTTRFPCERIWEGNWDDLTRAIENGSFSGLGDIADHLDRVFLIRVGQGQIDLACSPADLLALEEQPRPVVRSHSRRAPGCLGTHPRPRARHRRRQRDLPRVLCQDHCETCTDRSSDRNRPLLLTQS
ncbi:MAG: hypothetical protein JWM60_1648 [Solirubrobacterales bacterium]|nr:hypothetical protein [Solirubrobacterales bacterium]